MAHQLGCRVSTSVKASFTALAEKYGMSASELAKLVYLRENIHKQLARSVSGGTYRKPLRDTVQPGKAEPKVTAHYDTRAEIKAFDGYVKSVGVGLTRQDAAAWLLVRELSERWIEKALALPPEGAS